MLDFEREESFTISQLQQGTEKKSMIEQNSQVFFDLVEMTESEYEINRLDRQEHFSKKGKSSRHMRSTSLMGEGKEISELISAIIVPARKKLPRRHSSYEPRQKAAFHEAHMKMQEKLTIGPDDSIEKLLELGTSMGVASMNEMGTTASSPDSHRSCPALSVLSYLNDDDEDSFELSSCRKNLRPILTALPEEDSWKKNWETLEEEEADTNALHREYSVSMEELPQKDPFVRGKLQRNRRARSCTVLSGRLSVESPQQIAQSLVSGRSILF